MNTSKKILLADDDNMSLEFFEVMLSRLGYSVEKVGNGKEVVPKAKRFFPDLILLDNVMPGLSGLEVTKRLKNNENLKNIPIIMLSALGDAGNKVDALNAGVDDYISKPFNFSEVLARITTVLGNHELIGQITVREKRLILAEELYNELKENLLVFAGTINELDNAIVMDSGENFDKESYVKLLNEKIVSVRKQIAALDARIERTTNEWKSLKKNEIGVSTLENKIRDRHKVQDKKEAVVS